MPYASVASPAVTSTRARQVEPPPVPGPALGQPRAASRASTSAPTGTLISSTHRQDSASTSTPPTSPPAAPPPAPTAVQVAMARARAAPSGHRRGEDRQRRRARAPPLPVPARPAPPAAASRPGPARRPARPAVNRREPDQEHPLAAVEVPGPPAEQHEPGEGDGVRVDHPLQARRAHAQVGPHRRQRHVHDGHVEHDQELAGARERAHQPPRCGFRGGAGGVGPGRTVGGSGAWRSCSQPDRMPLASGFRLTDALGTSRR